MSMNAETIESTLAQFDGGGDHYKINAFANMTSGVKFLCDNAECYWLVTLILSHRCNAKVRREPFQVWTLTRNKTGSGAVAVCDDGNGNKLVTQRIPFTDFPLQSVKLYAVQDVGVTIMLPQEY